EHAERVISAIDGIDQRSRALGELGAALAEAQRWEHAERVISTIDESKPRARALLELALSLARAQQWERSDVIWSELKAVLETIVEDEFIVKGLSSLAD